jgi:hypothetical protein
MVKVIGSTVLNIILIYRDAIVLNLILIYRDPTVLNLIFLKYYIVTNW